LPFPADPHLDGNRTGCGEYYKFNFTLSLTACPAKEQTLPGDQTHYVICLSGSVKSLKFSLPQPDKRLKTGYF
jgi:hypothetical protein